MNNLRKTWELRKKRSYLDISGPCFPSFGLNTAECGKIRRRITLNTDIFHGAVVVEMILGFRSKFLVIQIKCPLKLSDSYPSSEAMRLFLKSYFY